MLNSFDPYATYEEEFEELIALRSRVEAGQLPMTRDLLLRAVKSFYVYCGAPFDDLTAEEGTWKDHREWLRRVNSWVASSQPLWINVFVEILVHPPPELDPEKVGQSELFTDFGFFFGRVAHRFPEQTMDWLNRLWNDATLHPRLIQMLCHGKEMSAEEWFGFEAEP